MKTYHRSLASGRWFKLSFPEQMANIGSEVFRAISAQKRSSQKDSRMAFERALELLDLTISDAKNKKRLRELTRSREMLSDYFVFDNKYNSNASQWQNYFFAFNYLARKNF